MLARAAREERILVTRDKDFGGLVFVEHLGSGVVFLRLAPATMRAVHQQLEGLLQTHSAVEFKGFCDGRAGSIPVPQIVVAVPTAYRLASIPAVCFMTRLAKLPRPEERRGKAG